MAQKVYWKSLRTVMSVTSRYIQRHQVHLEDTLTESQYNCVVSVLNAIIACLALLPENTPSN